MIPLPQLTASNGQIIQLPVLRNPYAQIVKLEQGTSSWLRWRQGGIGGSDMPQLMGVSPWGSAQSLWMEKTGLAKPRPVNWAMRRGTEMEPIARSSYIDQTEIVIHPYCVQSSQYSWMKASLDGLSFDGKTVVEIKVPGLRDHELACCDEIPPKYVPQCDYLLAITGANVLHYYSYRDDEDWVLLEHRPDPTRIAGMLALADQFWGYVTRKEPLPDNFGKV